MTKRFAVDLGWRTLLKDLNVRESRVLRRAALPEDVFTRPEHGLTTDEYFRFWSSLEAEVNDPLLPLRIMQAVTTEVFSPSLFAALCSPDLLHAARRLSKYKPLIAPMTLEVTVRTDGDLRISPRWLETTQNVPFTVMVTELAFFLRLARMATREDIRAVEVAGPTVAGGDQVRAYADFFGVRMIHAEVPSVTFRATDAQRPFLTANEGLWQLFEPDLRRRLNELNEQASLGERVGAVLLELLPAGEASIEAVAKRLNISKRTLQRRLDQEEVTFRSVVNQTRERLARHYLSSTRLSGGEIAFLLGFDDPNSFFRAFKDWTGQTPETLRHRPSLN